MRDNRETVRFFEIGRGLGEKSRRRDPDRATQPVANLFRNPTLDDGKRERRLGRIAIPTGQIKKRLVNGIMFHAIGQLVQDGKDTRRHRAILGRIIFHEHGIRDSLLGVGHRHADFHAEFLSLDGRRNHTPARMQIRADAKRLTAQRRVRLLLHGRKIRIHVHMSDQLLRTRKMHTLSV